VLEDLEFDENRNTTAKKTPLMNANCPNIYATTFQAETPGITLLTATIVRSLRNGTNQATGNSSDGYRKTSAPIIQRVLASIRYVSV